VSGIAPVVATLHRAGGQGPSTPDRRPRIDEEVLHRRAALLAESDGMPVAQPSLDRHRRPVAALDRTRLGGENRIVWGRDVHLDAELRAHDGHQLFQQPGSTRCSFGGGHSWTSRPVNQPASSRVLRASSTLRWLYASIVVLIEAWPRSSLTVSMPAPRRSSQV